MSFLLLLALINGITAQCLTENDSPTIMDPRSKSQLDEGRFRFAIESLKKSSEIQTSDNIFFSPESIYNAMALAYFGARGNTEASLKKALHIPEHLSKIDVSRYYAFEKSMKQANQINGSANYEYNSANRLWVTDTRKLRKCMLDLFGDELVPTDFKSDPSGVRNNINNWVSNITKGHIPDLLPEGSIDASTDLVLANAVYFKGLWQSRFDPANSKKDIFYASGSQNSLTTFMRQKKTFNHYVSEDLGAHVLELPYKGQDISMFVLLPPFAAARSLNDGTGSIEGDGGIRNVIQRISSETGASELQMLFEDGMPPRQVEVSLPRFSLERELQLVELLRSLGAAELVTPNVADLRGFLADGERTLHLGGAVHKAKIEVTEEGTTAAAATALFSYRSGRPFEPAIFNANHPFVYFIYDKKSHSILFSGIYRTPGLPTSSVPT